MLTVLTGMAAIAIDGARAYALRRDLQAAVDAAALAAADRLQQTGSYVRAEQAATANFAANIHLYSSPACPPSYGTPGAAPWTVTCTYPDGTVLRQVVTSLGPQGSQFMLTATRSLHLQFGRILTNGGSPTLAAASTSNVNNLAYTPAVAALDQDGCGGASGTAISVNGAGTLNVNGDVVSNGTITVTAGSLRVAGDIYARCQASVPGATAACYSSGGSSPCSYPDVAGATRAGFHLTDPNYPAPGNLGSGQGLPTAVVVPAGIYAAPMLMSGGHCWFLAGGVFTFQAGSVNTGDFVSNELKPPDEPDPSNNTQRAGNQFWNTADVNCAGSFQVDRDAGGSGNVSTGRWSFVTTSVRTDTYNGNTYTRESAPSMCQQVQVNTHFDRVKLDVSNVPGATSYDIYAAPPGNGCPGPFGLAANLPVSGPVLNTNTSPCPSFGGGGCSLGSESVELDAQISPPFAPNAAAAAGTIGAYPPDLERSPLAAGLPNQNPPSGAGAAGDRANENNCQSIGGVYQTCPGPITPGAVELYYPAGSCLTTTNGGDAYVFSGYQYNWISVYEPSSNVCTNTLGASSNSAYVGLVYTPSAVINITSPYAFESSGVGGVMADTVSFRGTLPTITFSAAYAPVPPASKLTG